MDSFGSIAADARAESPLWGAALRPADEREPVAVFSPLAPEVFALGLETVYEAYLVHYGRPRLFVAGEESERVLLGDYLYAHGLVEDLRGGWGRGGGGDGRADLELRVAARRRRRTATARRGSRRPDRSAAIRPRTRSPRALHRHSARMESSILQDAGTIPR